MCYSNDLVDNSLLEHGRFVPCLEFGSPEQAITEILDIVHVDCESKGLSCKVDLDIIKGTTMKFDYKRLQQVMLNLMKNAVKFSLIDGADIVIIAKLSTSYQKSK